MAPRLKRRKIAPRSNSNQRKAESSSTTRTTTRAAETSKKMRELTVPCLERLRDLIALYPDLVINCYDVKDRVYECNEDDTRDDRRTRRKRRSASSDISGSGDTSRSSLGRQAKRTALPKPAVSRQPPDDSNNNHVTIRKKTTAKRKLKPAYDANAKPGTLGSRQALNAPRSNRTRNGAKRQLPNEDMEAADSTMDLIDTKSMVEDTFLYSKVKFGQRANIISMPSDPEQLCQKFSIIIPDLELR